MELILGSDLGTDSHFLSGGRIITSSPGTQGNQLELSLHLDKKKKKI